MRSRQRHAPPPDGPRPAVLQRGAQLGAAPVDPAAHRTELDPERVRYLLVGQSLDVAENDGRTVLGRERLQRRLDVVVKVPVIEGLGGRGTSAAQPRRGLVAQPLEPDPLPPASHVQKQVGRDAVQPALEGARGVAGQRPEDADEDLLGEVLGVMSSCRSAGRQAGKPARNDRGPPHPSSAVSTQRHAAAALSSPRHPPSAAPAAFNTTIVRMLP